MESRIKFIRNGRVFLLGICLLASQVFLYAQPSGAEVKKYDLKLVGFKQGNKVYLRWLLGSAMQWRMANTKGYILERAEVGSTNFVKLTTSPIRQISNLEVVKLNKNSDEIKIMGIILQKPDFNKPEIKIQEQTLYGMYFLLSSYAIKNALISASGFVDSTIQKDKKYKYRISIANVKLTAQNTASYIIDAIDNNIPAPPEITGDFIKNSVQLKWDNKDIQKDYFAIILEKSIDSIHFKSVTKNPFLTTVSNKALEGDNLRTTTQYTDTAIRLGIKYYYRLRGLNIFGLSSKPSKVLAGMVTMDLVNAPVIHFLDTLRSKYILDWTMPPAQNALVEKYQVLYSSTGDDSSYNVIKEVNGGKDLVAAFDFTPNSSNYFRVKAIGIKKEQIYTSKPYLYQLHDSIPPAIPIGLVGSIDKKGIVSLKWSNNTEKDLKGYKILKRYNNSNSFSLLNASPRVDTVFTDTLPLNQLNLVSSYSVTALDNRYNESEKSAFIKIYAPDTIPPAPPKLLNVITNAGGGHQINWVKSFSKDVKGYVIYRKELTDTINIWTKYAEIKMDDTTFTDILVKSSISYLYKIAAIDKGDLISVFSDSIKSKITTVEKVEDQVITKFNVYIAKEYKYIELTWWTGNTDNVSEYQLYRVSNKSNGAIRLVTSLPANIKRYVDEDIASNTIYTYYLKVLYKSGKSSKFTKVEASY